MKMYENYESSRDQNCNKYFDSQDNALISYFLPNEYYPEENNASPVDYMREFQGSFNGIDSTATSKQLLFKTDPDEGAEEWKSKEGKDWTSNDVLHWIASVAESQKFPYEFVNANAFNVDGKTLLSLTKKEFVESDEKYGGLLYHALHRSPVPRFDEISTTGTGTTTTTTTTTTTPQYKQDAGKTEVRLETLSTSSSLAAERLFPFACKTSKKGPPYGLVSGTPEAYSNELAHSPEPYPFELNPPREEGEREAEKGGAARSPDGGERKNSEDSFSSSSSSSSETEHSEVEFRQRQSKKKSGSGKRPPGRPPGNKSGKKEKPEKKTGRLWEFIRDLLLDPQHCPSVICWENHDDGVFRFVKSEKVAKIWGDRKGNEKMNYEKLSRAMRYYYRSKVLQPVLGRRLVYKFGPTARGWKAENPNFRH